MNTRIWIGIARLFALLTLTSVAYGQQTYNTLKIKELTMPSGTADTVLYLDSTKKVQSSTTTSAELGNLSGVSGPIQDQLNAKQDTITGAASTVTTSNLGTNYALQSDGTGKITTAPITATELGYLSGTNAAVQTQLNTKQPTITGAATTVTTSNLSVSKALQSDSSGKISASSTVDSTELGYLDGVTSPIQTQINTNSTNIGTNATNLSTHISSTTPHTTVSGASIQNPTRLDSKKDTKANLTTYASTAQNGEIVFATDTKEFFVVKDAALSVVGGGGLSPWVTAKAYKTGEVIYTNDKIYVALSDHTSGTFSSDLGTLKWKLLSDQFNVSNEQGTQQTIRELRFPKNQITQVSSDIAIAETGNRNRLINPGFEHQTPTTGWLTALTGTATLSKTANAISPINGIGTSMSLGCDGGASGGTCTFYQDVATSKSRQGLVGIDLISDTASGVEVYSRLNGANNLSFPIKDLNLEFRRIPQNLGTTSTGVAVKITVAASQSILVQVDEGFVGVADLKQDLLTATPWLSYTPVFSACWGSPTNIEMQWRQIGENVEVRGKFTTGTTSTAECRIGLPNNYTSAGTSKIPSIQVAGKGNRAAGNGTDFSGRAILIEPSVTYFTVGNESSTAFGLTKSTGVTATGELFSFYASTPIAGLSGSTSTYSSTNADTDPAPCVFSTSAWAGLGNVDYSQLKCSRKGGNLIINGKVVVGTTSATTAAIPMPVWSGQATVVSSTKISSGVSSLGRILRNNGGANIIKEFTLLVSPSATSIAIGAPEYAVATAPLTALGGSAISSSETINFENISIPIEGWDSSNIITASLSGLESCTTTLSCADSFSAKVSSTDVVSDEDYDFINGNCTNATSGQGTCTWNSGIFTQTPNCYVMPKGGAQGYIVSESATGLTYEIRTSAGTTTDSAVSILCKRTGADSIFKTARAVASDANIKTTGATGVDIQQVYFGSGANCSSQCTTGTCSICWQVGTKITSVTWSATGTYRLNGIDGLKYNCIGSGVGGAYASFVHDKAGSTTSFANMFSGQGGGISNSGFNNIMCIGVP
jgi:hypothetical protein